MLLQAMCIIPEPLVDSNLSYSLETPNLGQNQRFWSRVTLKFDGWPWKTIGQLFYATSSFVHDFVAIRKFKLELRAYWGTICFDLCDLDLWPLTLTFCMDITFVYGNNSWKFQDDTMRET